jgi:acetoin:2,6-dichlorophenolindophenol oxidoreductase subunit beta
MNRQLTFAKAIHEALDLSLKHDPTVLVMGLGVPDPKGVFGTTLGLQQAHGDKRVFDMPIAENAVTGVLIGASLVGMRPVLIHQRLDFALVSIDQIVNQAAKWHYMFGGQLSVPIVIRMIIGRGWGQGPQHSQSLQSWFGHVPGLKVVMPATPYDAKGLLISAIEDENPVIFLEHRWLHNIEDHVPEGMYRTPIGRARVMSPGTDLTIAATSYMALESNRAAEMLSEEGISAEVIDVRTIKPLDESTILQSVHKTGRLIVADTGWRDFGFAAELIARTAEQCLPELQAAPVRITLPDLPAPTSPALSAHYYPTADHIVAAALKMFGRPARATDVDRTIPHDIPDLTFTGPF